MAAPTTPQVLTDADGIQFEKVAALQAGPHPRPLLRPDQGGLRQLSKIARPWRSRRACVDYGIAWQELTRTVGKAVGKPAEADKLVADVEATIAAAKAAQPRVRRRDRALGDQLRGHLRLRRRGLRGRLLKSLGFNLPDGLDDVTGTEFGANLSRERTDLLDIDVLIWLVDNYAKAKATIQGEPLYAALEVEKEGRDVFIEDGEVLGSAASFITVLSLPYLLERLVPQLKQAIDGDPRPRSPGRPEPVGGVRPGTPPTPGSLPHRLDQAAGPQVRPVRLDVVQARLPAVRSEGDGPAGWPRERRRGQGPSRAPSRGPIR